MKQLYFPGAFYVGSDILYSFTSYVSGYGKKIVFVGGKRSLEAVKEPLEQSFANSNCTCSFVECGRIASLSEIKRISDMQEVKDAEVLCGTGGGSSMDITRTVANRMGKKLVMLPTTAASDAPCSRVSVFYADDGSEVTGDEIYLKCPDLIMVDSGVIANAPERQFASGMGDALATYYEAAACFQNPGGTGITETAVMMSRLCRDIVLRDGLAAYRAVEKHIVTPQLENVIEADCFLSGAGGINTGCAGAHGIGDYLCRIAGGHDFMHGERVFIGLMIQMILEQYPEEEIRSLMRFGRSVGLPVALGDMIADDLREEAFRIARGLQGDHFMVNLCCDFSENILAGSILYAQSMADNLE